jgi:hypothetical protein
MKHENSFTCSQELAIDPYHEPDQSTPYTPILIFSLISLFWKNIVGLWDHVAVRVCGSVYPPPR